MRRLPLFVLPVVLLPGALMPLHIFEPRYRRMVAHCLEADRRFGLLFRDFDEEPGGFEPAEGQIGCIAEIRHFQPIPDGRSLLLAEGIERFRVLDGIESDSPYHEALVDEYADVAQQPGDIAERRMHALQLLQRVVHRLQPGTELPELDPCRDVSFLLAAALQATPQWKQLLLELPTERARLHQIVQLLTPLADDAGLP